MKSEKIIRLLLEMLELDASEYVRLMVSWLTLHVSVVYICSYGRSLSTEILEPQSAIDVQVVNLKKKKNVFCSDVYLLLHLFL